MNAPMVLVQHMPAGFTKTMADRLNEVSKVSVKEAQEGDVLQKGTVYIAPGGKHMLVKKMPGGGHKITLSDAAPIGGLCIRSHRMPKAVWYMECQKPLLRQVQQMRLFL